MVAEEEILHLGGWGDGWAARDTVFQWGGEMVAEEEILYLGGWGDGRAARDIVS